jgi:hypothetical protein
MRTNRKIRFVLATLLALGATSLWAQHPQVRRGFWIWFGFGYGPLKPSCDGCGTLNSKSSFTGHLRLGGTLSPKLLLGGDVVAWTKSESGVDDLGGNTTASLYFYPTPQSGLFLKGGVGIAIFSESVSGGGPSADGRGVGFTLGAGYDIRVGRNISITPVGNFLFGSVGDLTSSGTTVVTGWKQTIIEFGLDVTFH